MITHKLENSNHCGGTVGLGAVFAVALFCSSTALAQPSAVSVTPSSGSGTSDTFTYTASSPNGFGAWQE
jgi:hypothetical protein